MTHIGFKHTEDTKKRMSLASKGKKKKPFSEQHKKHISEAKKKNPIRYWLGKKNPTKYWLGKKRPDMTGEKNHFWRGGTTDINTKIRISNEYKLWRQSVFERDKYTCIWCGQVGDKLHADHIKPFCDYPELRFAIDNGRTLCIECHKKTDTYLGKARWNKK
jgi:5-methylcytosine-specific restriction endonuclease McrA